jgi:hypothetical protein
VDAEDDPDKDEPLLCVGPEALLIAALIAKDYLPQSYSDTKVKLAKHREMALDWIDWAVCESDLGRVLTEARAQAAANKKSGGGIRYIGLPPI